MIEQFSRLWLCGYLLAWVPLNYAVEASSALPSIDMRGLPAGLELLVHGLVGALSAAAGWMLWTGNPAGPALASAAVVVAALMSVQSLYWSALPHDVPPGTKLPTAAIAVVHGFGWFVYLRRRA